MKRDADQLLMFLVPVLSVPRLSGVQFALKQLSEVNIAFSYCDLMQGAEVLKLNRLRDRCSLPLGLYFAVGEEIWDWGQKRGDACVPTNALPLLGHVRAYPLHYSLEYSASGAQAVSD